MASLLNVSYSLYYLLLASSGQLMEKRTWKEVPLQVVVHS